MVEVAMRHFATQGYQQARVGDIASELKIAKGSVFQYFGTKEGLFLAAYKKAVSSFPAYLDAPRETQESGFWRTLHYWLIRTEHLVREDWIPYRVALLGNYGTDLGLRREINRFLVKEDPYGTLAFVQWGIARREVRGDVDREMIVSILDWTMERFQDALLTEELDPGLFRRQGVRAQVRIDQFLAILKSAIGTR
jgi:TetR/AcrR family transcriptional regulator